MPRRNKNIPDFMRSESERLYTPENVSMSTISVDDNLSDIRRDSIGSNQRRRTRRNRKRERLNTQILDAAQTDDLEKCRRLIEEGADVNAMCHESGSTVLMVSAAWGNDDIVSFLLEKEASPLIRDYEGRTPAHAAAARGNEGSLRLLLESKNGDVLKDAQVEITDHRDEYHKYFDSWIHEHDTLLPKIPKLPIGSTPLHAASQTSNGGCVKLLLDKGADTEIRDSRGLTSLDVAGEIFHRTDNCQHHEHAEGNSEFRSKPKSSSCAARSFLIMDNRSEGLGFDEHKLTTMHVIEEIEAIRRLRFGKSESQVRSDGSSSSTNESNDDESKSLGFVKEEESEDSDHAANFRRKTRPVIPFEKRDKKPIMNCLHSAVKQGDENLVKYLADEKSHYVYQQDENGCTPAHLAVGMKDLKILALLLDKNDAVNVQDNKGRSLLYRAVELDWISGVDFLLNANADITKPAEDGSTVLHVAARKTDSKLLEELFTFDDVKKVVNEFDKNGQTPLCCAVDKSSVKCVEYLLMHDASPTAVQPGKLTLLHVAAKNGTKKILELLIKSGAAILVDNFTAHSEGGMTPLHVSCKEGHADCVRLLIQFRANIFNLTKTKGKPYYGATPLHLAARYGHVDVADILIKFDKDVLDQRNSDLWLPIHVAARFGKTECVRLFLKCGDNLASELHVCGYRKTALDVILNFIPQPIEFLQEVFDSFMDTNNYPLTHSDCIVTLKYDLLSPSHADNKKQLLVLDAVINSPKIVIQEIILLHPLAETFLFLKWKKLRIFFFLIFAVYCVLTLSVSALCLTNCTDVLPYSKYSVHCYQVITIVSLIFLVTQEIFLATRSLRYYCSEMESWVKWTVFLLAGILCCPELHSKEESRTCPQNISSVAVLLSWVELLLLLSRLPNWGFSVLMFCRVAQNVVKVMATFSILFIGFMFTFMIEFGSQPPFPNVWQSLTKVIVMTSELEYSDMFSTDGGNSLLWSLVARCIFMSFVILVTIVLMNLMVGLAVNDITLLEAQGRTRRLAKQVNFLNLIEMFVYNRNVLKLFPACLKNVVKKRRKVPLKLELRTGKPHKHDMKIFPMHLRNSILERVSSIKKADQNNDLKDLNDKIDRLIKQQKQETLGSLSSLNSDDTVAHRNVTLSMLQQLASTLQEVKTELNLLKTNFETRRSIKDPKMKSALLRA